MKFKLSKSFNSEMSHLYYAKRETYISTKECTIKDLLKIFSEI